MRVICRAVRDPAVPSGPRRLGFTLPPDLPAHSPRAPRVALLLLLLLTALGCGSSVTISVPRPAQINARAHGGTLSVVPFGGHPEGARVVTQALIERARRVDDRVLIYARNGGNLIIQGSVIDFEHAETMRRTPTACPRTSTAIRVGMGRSCYSRERRVTAFATIFFEVIDRRSGERLMTATLTDSQSRTQRSLHSSPTGEGRLMLSALTEGLIERFARVIFPWREEVRVRFGRCGEARALCDEGVQAMSVGSYGLAARAFGRAVRRLRQDGAQGRNRALAQAYWNLGLAREYAGDFERAVRAIRRARRHDPRNDDYRRELRNIRRMEEDREELLRQGL